MKMTWRHLAFNEATQIGAGEFTFTYGTPCTECNGKSPGRQDQQLARMLVRGAARVGEIHRSKPLLKKASSGHQFFLFRQLYLRNTEPRR